MRAVVLLAASSSAACGGGGTPGSAAGAEGDAALATAGSTTFARKFGGLGDEVAAGMALGADGSVVALSRIDGPMIGMTRVTASGQTLWSRTFAATPGGDGIAIAGVAVTPEFGNIFVGLEVLTGGTLDLGGGAFTGNAVVKFSPGGSFVWQRRVEGLVTGVAVDANGSVLVGSATSLQGIVAKYRWNGDPLWIRFLEASSANQATEVAFDPEDAAVVASGLRVQKLSPAGDSNAWSVALEGKGVIEHVGTTALGTVVVGGFYFGGPLTLGGDTLPAPPVGFQRSFLAAIERDGRPRWLRSRPGFGPFSVDPLGRLGVIERDFTFCGDAISRWDLAGNVLWRRPVVRCGGAGPSPATAHVAVAPDHGIWIQGFSRVPFDVGTGMLTPGGTDWFLARLAP